MANINRALKWKCHYLSSGEFRAFWLPLFLPTSHFRITNLAEASQDADSRAEVCMQEGHPEHSHKHRKEAESRTAKGVSGSDPSELSWTDISLDTHLSARQATPQVVGEEMGLGSTHILLGGSEYLQTEGSKNHILLLYRRGNAYPKCMGSEVF